MWHKLNLCDGCLWRDASPHQHASGEQGELGGVGVQADLMLSRCV